mgnify:CR=1 FL=1
MIEIFILSLIQGVAEFLPISSSSHLILMSEFLDFENKSLSIDLVRKGIVSIVISPGWVRTDMGGPEATVGPVESVAGIRTVIKGLKLEDNGKFFNFNGSHINW